MVEPRKRVAPKARAKSLAEGDRDLTQEEQGHRQDDQGAMQDAQGHRQDDQEVTQVDQGVTQDAQGVTQVDQGHRQDTQEHRQKTQGARQDTQGLTQDAQGLTQDHQGITQAEQGATQLEQGLTQTDQAAAIAAQSMQILAITDGVGLLASNVERLNTGVYAKNKLDKSRNRLIAAAVLTFLILSTVLGSLLWRINENAEKEGSRARQRAAEAVEARHQLADCTTPPGVVLEKGYVNPGVCYTTSATRTQGYLDDLTARIAANTREILAGLAESTASNTSLSGEVRRSAAAQARTLRAPPPTPVPPAAVVQPPPAPSSTPAPVSPASRGLIETVVCGVLSLVGACSQGA